MMMHTTATPPWRERLRTLVELESPSSSPEAVNRALDQVATWAGVEGARVVRHPQADFGDVAELWFSPATPSAAKPLLILGHLDTVWPLGTLQKTPWREAPDAEGRMRLWGPGVLDMKAGVVMALEAIAAAQANGGLRRPVCLLLNPDEEVGSPVSRAHTERLARGAEAVFVMEPAQGLPGTAANAAYKTARKGVGHYRMQVQGVASHAGVDFELGRSAILELARLLPRVAALTDPTRGITLNPGVIGGGSAPNVVASTAWAEIDLRISQPQDAVAIEAALQSLCCSDPACSLAVTGGINRPPMERGSGTVQLFRRAQALAAGMDIDLGEASTGGGSDGNFTAALGVPTLDGMGAVGEGAHAVNESILLDQVSPRTALLASMIANT